MILTTHALVGASAAVLFPQQPVEAFALGFASHFVLDALPHWAYDLRSIKKDPKDPLATDMPIGPAFWKDLAATATDSIAGVALAVLIFSFWIFHAPIGIVILAACAGILPDFLQFVYFKTRAKILKPLQYFHAQILQGEGRPKLRAKAGILSQAALVVLIIAALKIALG